MSLFPEGSGVLLCPTGEGGSTISETKYQDFATALYGELVELGPAEFSQWLSNAKKITVEQTREFTFTQYGETSVESLSNTYEFKQWAGDAFSGYYNDSDHPFPMNYYLGETSLGRQGMEFIADDRISGGGQVARASFYYRGELTSGSPFESPPEAPVFPMFIRDDKFYMFISYDIVSDYTTRNIEVSPSKITREETETIVYDEGSENESRWTRSLSSTYEITERFY